MKKIIMFMVMCFLVFTGCLFDSPKDPEAQKIGKFAVQKIDTADKTMKRSISEMNGGTINSSIEVIDNFTF